MSEYLLSRQQPAANLGANFGAMARAIWQGLALMLMRRRSRRMLARLDDRMLRDIGVSRNEARIEAAKPFWQA